MGLPTIRLVHLYCVVLGATAMFFWVWAILNVLNQKAAFDLGIVSFFTVLVACALGLVGTIRLDLRWRRVHSYALLCSCLLVVLNYIAGIFARRVTAFQVYCGVAAALWAVAGVVCFPISRRWVAQGQDGAIAIPQ